jgi:hypothetical protein
MSLAAFTSSKISPLHCPMWQLDWARSRASPESTILSMSSLWLWTARGRLDERCTGKNFIIFFVHGRNRETSATSRFSLFNSSCFYYQLSRLSFLQTAAIQKDKTRFHILVFGTVWESFVLGKNEKLGRILYICMGSLAKYTSLCIQLQQDKKMHGIMKHQHNRGNRKNL